MTGQEAKDWLNKEIKFAEMFGKHSGEAVTRSFRKTELEDLLKAITAVEQEAYAKGYRDSLKKNNPVVL